MAEPVSCACPHREARREAVKAFCTTRRQKRDIGMNVCGDARQPDLRAPLPSLYEAPADPQADEKARCGQSGPHDADEWLRVQKGIFQNSTLTQKRPFLTVFLDFFDPHQIRLHFLPTPCWSRPAPLALALSLSLFLSRSGSRSLLGGDAHSTAQNSTEGEWLSQVAFRISTQMPSPDLFLGCLDSSAIVRSLTVATLSNAT